MIKTPYDYKQILNEDPDSILLIYDYFILFL
jgi:hypothetical protein